ncbi:hypothetical protein HMPREF3107_01515 [Neisseria sp. HMSC31F04]|uniref:hypothetical protein n=1 Tax=Neisseria sp. HMSC31F04 TaxID=1581075 RepID=UPI0008A41234|nr:hypothetical protein [Neisseria sp. HMSC31F04]OFT03730.1 hypothetical protein HMPREF3107_01515 [Neisseria sp. HMSC31F04]
MTESFHIAYQLHDAGWASVTVKYGEESHQQAVSYLHDSLKDLCNLALALQSGSSITEAKVLFLDEPGELVLLVSAAEQNNEAEVKLIYSDDCFFNFNRSPQQALWHGKVDRYELAENIRLILEDIYLNIGEKEYLERWIEHPFPKQGYLKLRHL